MGKVDESRQRETGSRRVSLIPRGPTGTTSVETERMKNAWKARMHVRRASDDLEIREWGKLGA